jgi:pimeloyl-ACP methyl ester carboxylesterase
MGTVNCNGVSLNYRGVGKGKNIVLIHGLAANHAFWHIEVLLSLAKNYRVTLYDLRGHGYSSMPSCNYTTAAMATDLHHLLNHLHIDRTHLIGHSYGGAVALHYAILYPESVDSLVIAGFFIPETEDESGLWLLEQLALPKWQKARHKLEGSPLFIPFSRWGGGKRSAVRWLELLQSTTARQDFISPDGLTINRLSTIRHPTLAICGADSPTLPSFRGLQKQLPNCKAEIIPKAGHFFPLTHPKLFVTIVSQFLKDIEIEDRRQHTRFPLKFPVELQWGDVNCYPAATVDVSMKGILLASTRVLEVGSEIGVVTNLGQEGSQISVEGKVVRFAVADTAGDYHFGIELIKVDEGYFAWQNFLVNKTRETLSMPLV